MNFDKLMVIMATIALLGFTSLVSSCVQHITLIQKDCLAAAKDAVAVDVCRKMGG